MDTADRLGLGCGMAIFLFLPGTPPACDWLLTKEGSDRRLSISTPSDFSSMERGGVEEAPLPPPNSPDNRSPSLRVRLLRRLGEPELAGTGEG